MSGIRGVRWSGWTHPGRFRSNNEDAFLAIRFDRDQMEYLGKVGEVDFEHADLVFAVSDGMGGANAGEFASRIAVDVIARLMPRSFHLGAAGFGYGGEDFIEELFQKVHDEMVHQGSHYEECRGMGATLSLCWIGPRFVIFGHLGDSRIYFLPADGGIRQVSEDHTHVAWLVRTGQISATEARFHPQRNLLRRSLGGREKTMEPQVGTVVPEPGDRLLLCSDGLTEGISDPVIESIIRTPPPRIAESPVGERLIGEAMDASRDNVTALVVEFY